ncbi:hypothetical protein BWZ20_00770 [Winogradskyella sp. J14-2]|uniref:restriction endonuclease subunit S n=1 Tax=Winogradskyella sp. J14-2 TaxID=1936080 RepID=UPI00097279C2|nr:restriction endonuclease subunit S [Winogradskyella sp. J14-2]APY06918.1 hypothetical protein BWZ20_00770 [Winogradskyella sp. J14-2]
MPNNWKTYKLEELTTKLGDGLHGTPKYSPDGEYYFINGNNLTDGKIEIKQNTKRVNRDQFIKYQKPLNDRTIFVSINGTLGNVATYNSEKVVLGKSACYFNVKEDVHKEFIKHYVSTSDFRRFLENNATGSVIKNVSLKSMREHELNLPPLPEQKAIANILSAIDDKIENNLAINKTLEDMAMALYKHWFVDFEFPVSQENRNPELVSGSQPIGYKSAGGEFTDSELGPIPKGWEVRKVKDLGEVVTGNTPSKKYPEHYGNEVPFVTPTDFKNYGKHILNANRGLSNSGIEKYTKKIIPKNSVVVTCIGSDMGKVALCKTNCLTNQQINSLKTNHFLYMYCFFVYNYSMLKMLAGAGTTMPIINKSRFEEIEVIMPTSTVLNSFEKNMSYLDEQIFNNTKENQSLTQLRDTLLPKLISGEVRLKEFKEQVESVIASEEGTTQSYEV